MAKTKRSVDVFISYKREDYARAGLLAGLLSSLKLNVWWDASLAGGEVWPDRIEKSARRAKCIVVGWTKAAATSEWIKREMEIGLEREVLVPVRFGAGALPASMKHLHVPDLREWAGEADHQGIKQFVSGLEPFVGGSLSAKLAELAGGQNPAAVAALRSHLVKIARKGARPISYEQALDVVAPTLLHGKKTPYRTLFGALDAIAEQNRTRREPPLFGLVVDPDERLPGKGYFEKHCFLEYDTELSEKVHAAQLEAIYAHEWASDP